MEILNNKAKKLSFTFNGKDYNAKEGDSIATALFINDIKTNKKTFENKKPRGSFCFMGVCFECLVKVDGISGIQGCKTKLCDGVKIEIEE